MPNTGLKCMRCRYDLRSAAGEGRCPECGTSVAASIEAAKSRSVDQPRLREIAMPMLIAEGAVILLNIVLWPIAGNANSLLDVCITFTGLWFVVSIGWLMVAFCLVFVRGVRKAALIALAMCLISVVATLVNFAGIMSVAL